MMLVDGHTSNGAPASNGEIDNLSEINVGNTHDHNMINGDDNGHLGNSYDEDSLEMSYRNKILEYKWEIERKRYQKARLWAASNDGK